MMIILRLLTNNLYTYTWFTWQLTFIILIKNIFIFYYYTCNIVHHQILQFPVSNKIHFIIIMCLINWTYTSKMIPKVISWSVIFKIFLGGMSPDPPGVSMLCMLNVLHTITNTFGIWLDNHNHWLVILTFVQTFWQYNFFYTILSIASFPLK